MVNNASAIDQELLLEFEDSQPLRIIRQMESLSQNSFRSSCLFSPEIDLAARSDHG